MISWIYSSSIAKMITTFTRKVALIRLPVGVRKLVLKRISKILNIRVQEAEKPLKEYESLNALFTRALTPLIRPINQDPNSIVSSTDGKIQEMGTLSQDQLIQAKGITYSVDTLIGLPVAEKFHNGHFITIYLSPKDCHRIFAPASGTITSAHIIPGNLYPVRSPFIEKTPGLYNLNERLITFLQSDFGLIAIVKVGAINVGTVSVQYDETLRSNTKQSSPQTQTYSPPISINKGDWLGTFHLGSTVILLFEPNTMTWHKILKGQPIKYGEKIAFFQNS